MSSRPSPPSTRLTNCAGSVSSRICLCFARTGTSPTTSARRSPCSPMWTRRRSCRCSRPTPSTRSRSSSRRSASGGGWFPISAGAGCERARPHRLADAGGLIKAPKPTLEIALVGKYIGLPDAYLSLAEALRHVVANGVDVKVRWMRLRDPHAGDRRGANRRRGRHPSRGRLRPSGGRGQVVAAIRARRHRLPFLGLCLGLHGRGVRVRSRYVRADAPTPPRSISSPPTR